MAELLPDAGPVKPRDAAGSEPCEQSTASLLQALLCDRDVSCPLCAYNLRNLTGTRCPECGGELKLQIGLVEPRLGVYITLLTACCVGLGGSALFTIVALTAAPGDWWRKVPAIILVAQLLITGALLPFILARQAQFRRAPKARQRAMVIALCLLVVTLSAAFVATFHER